MADHNRCRSAALRDPSDAAAYSTTGDKSRLFRSLLIDPDQADIYGRVSSQRDFPVWKHAPAFIRFCQEAQAKGVPVQVPRDLAERVGAVRPLANGRDRVSLRRALGFGDLGDRPTTAVVSAMPKSASTYFCNVIASYRGLPLVAAHDQNDFLGVHGDLDWIRNAVGRPSVVHSHHAASLQFRAVVHALDLRPVVLVRNVFDALRSYADHLGGHNVFGPRVRHLAMPERLELAASMVGFYYVYFFATWMYFARVRPVMLLGFEDVVHDTQRVAGACLGYLGETVDPERLRSSIERVRSEARNGGNAVNPSRYNVGVSGRGKDVPDPIRQQVRAFYRLYPDIDFSRIDPGFRRDG